VQRRALVLLIVLASAATAAILLLVRNPEPPFLPSDPDHATFESAERCLGCHGPGGPRPRSPNHPIGRECLRCHAVER
jgi:hypothetical protein